MDEKPIYGLRAGQNETDPTASVPEGWRKQDFQPLNQQHAPFKMAGWLVALLIVLFVLAIVAILYHGKLSSTLGAAFGAGIFIIALLFFAILSIGLYLLPGIIAIQRHHRNRVAIFACNIIFGWTFIGWGIALVWAFTKNTESS